MFPLIESLCLARCSITAGLCTFLPVIPSLATLVISACDVIYLDRQFPVQTTAKVLKIPKPFYRSMRLTIIDFSFGCCYKSA